MKKIISYLLLGVLALLLVGCKKDDPVYTLTLSGADTVEVGAEITLTATSTKPQAVFVWSSSDDAVATVKDGLVKGVSKGTAVIKVTVADVGEKTLTVTVTEKVVFTLALSGEETVKVGETITLTATSTKPQAVFVWSSSNDAVATVKDGLVKGVSKGTAVIKVTVADVGEKSMTVTVTEEVVIITPKEYTPAELKDLLEGVLDDYSKGLAGYVKIEAVNGPNVLTSELMFNFNNDPGIESMMYTLNGTEVAHVYVKDGIAYMLRNQAKTKAEMTATEEATIINNYGFDKFVQSVAAFYSEVEFYDALTFVSRVDDVLTYNLDLAGYLGDVFVTEGKDSITLKVYLGAEDIVLKVETLIVKGTQNNYTILEFKGLGPQTIPYPVDLDAYE
ncbi:MAG TPA: Ig-like domain-containing protein [Bacilli bacterium]|nr:MAG: Bacterial Ig-like domain (group 2) [Tenericutes bacterium ADurb.BinA124]HPX84596.1 Ig-like domain-containing protein [Bacilli bacterium]HQC74553.1 Ig-like domain-containing protein [Bacilli bacterium]